MALTYSQMLPLGTDFPKFKLYNVVNDKQFNSDDYEIKDCILVMVICNHCPYVIHYHDQLKKLVSDFSQSVSFIAISSNNVITHPEDSPDKMKKLFQKLNFDFPYLYDETQEVARLFKAECTPEFYLYDDFKKLVYRGRLDDSSPGNGKEIDGKDLRSAIDSFLKGKKISSEQFPSMGCNIKWK